MNMERVSLFSVRHRVCLWQQPRLELTRCRRFGKLDSSSLPRSLTLDPVFSLVLCSITYCTSLSSHVSGDLIEVN